MATDKTVNQQTEDTSPTTDDFILVWDTGSGTTKKVSIANFLLLSNAYKFNVYLAAAQNVGTAPTKVLWDTKNYDTGTNFDVATNHRFVAAINGFYRFSVNILTTTAGAGTNIAVYLYKNGLSLVTLGFLPAAAGASPGLSGSTEIQLTATDYIEIYIGTATAAKALDVSVAGNNTFSGSLVSKG